jgi:multiple sugar transport system substrate-binding protein
MAADNSAEVSLRDMSRRDFLKLSGGSIASASLLAACSGVAAGFTGQTTVNEDTLIFSHGPESSGTLAKVIDKFNKENGKGIRVAWRVAAADSGQYFDKLRTEFQAGGGDTDVISADVVWPIQFAANGWLEDLSDLFTEELRSEYLPAPLEAVTYKEKLYGVPWFTDFGMFYYRKDLLEKSGFKKPPETWDEVRQMGLKVQEDSGTKEVMVLQGAEYEGGVCNGCEYVWNAGGDVLDPNNVNRVIIGSVEAVRGLETERSLITDGLAPLSVAVYKEQEAHTAFLTNEESIFARNWPYMLGLAADPALSKVKPEAIGVSALPVEQKGNQSFSALGGWNFTINAASDKKEQAWEFIKYMSDPAVQGEIAIAASLLPTKKAVYKDKKVTKEQPTVGLAADLATNAKTRPTHPFYSDMSLLLAEGYNESLKGDVSPERTVRGLQDELARITEIGERVYDLA